MINEWHGCVYVHTNLINGKQYVGQTIYGEKRWEHGGIDYQGCTAFYEDIQKYGWDNFTHEILESGLNPDEADNMEQKYIRELNTLTPNRYNSFKGGGMAWKHYKTEEWIATRFDGYEYLHGNRVGRYSLDGKELLEIYDYDFLPLHDIRVGLLDEKEHWFLNCLRGNERVRTNKRRGNYFWKYESYPNKILDNSTKVPYVI